MILSDKKSYIINNKTGKIISGDNKNSSKAIKKIKDDKDYVVMAHLDNGVFKMIAIKSYWRLMKIKSITSKRNYQIVDHYCETSDGWETILGSKYKIESVEALLAYYVTDGLFIKFFNTAMLAMGEATNSVFPKYKIKYVKGKEEKMDHMEFNRTMFMGEKSPLCMDYIFPLNPSFEFMDELEEVSKKTLNNSLEKLTLKFK